MTDSIDRLTSAFADGRAAKYVRMDGNGDIVRVTHAVYERIRY
jgi:hypothetical protein